MACRTPIKQATQVPCGSELARECIGSGNEDVECAALFASKLAPTLDFACRRDLAHAAKTCGSELARECIGSGNEDVECAALFASKLAPTLDFACRRDLAHAAKTCGSELAREGIRSGDENIGCAAVFASRLAPTGICGEAQTCNNCRVIAIEVSSDCPVRCNLFSRLAPSQS